MQTADLIILWQRKSELLGVVVDVLNGLELQRDEALVTASEGLFAGSPLSFVLCLSHSGLCLGLCILRGILDFVGVLVVIVISTAS